MLQYLFWSHSSIHHLWSRWQFLPPQNALRLLHVRQRSAFLSETFCLVEVIISFPTTTFSIKRMNAGCSYSCALARCSYNNCNTQHFTGFHSHPLLIVLCTWSFSQWFIRSGCWWYPLFFYNPTTKCSSASRQCKQELCRRLSGTPSRKEGEVVKQKSGQCIKH